MSVVAMLLLCGGACGADAAEPKATGLDDRAAVRRAFVDTADAQRMGVWWWDGRSRQWSPAPDATWHGEVVDGDARWRWVDVAAVRHLDVPGRGRWAMVLDPGQALEREPSDADAGVGGAKLVAMSALTGGVSDAWWFDHGHEVLERSRLQDFVVDTRATLAVIHDAGTASVVVVDLASRRVHRALEGCVPAEATLVLDEARGWLMWRISRESVAWRVPLAELRDARLDALALLHLREPVVVATRVASEAESAAPVMRVDIDRDAVSLAQRWVRAGLGRGTGADEAAMVLQREAARGTMEAMRRRVVAQEP